jgi:hypothetical protein
LSNQLIGQQRTVLTDELGSRAYLNSQHITAQQYMQGQGIAMRNCHSQPDADTRTAIAGIQVSTADKDKISTIVANIQAQQISRINTIIGNPDIPAETRAE